MQKKGVIEAIVDVSEFRGFEVMLAVVGIQVVVVIVVKWVVIVVFDKSYDWCFHPYRYRCHSMFFL